MSRVLSSLRIVHKIIGISGTGVLGLLVVGGIYLSGQASRDRYGDIAHEMQAVAGLASKLHIELLESRLFQVDEAAEQGRGLSESQIRLVLNLINKPLISESIDVTTTVEQ